MLPASVDRPSRGDSFGSGNPGVTAAFTGHANRSERQLPQPPPWMLAQHPEQNIRRRSESREHAPPRMAGTHQWFRSDAAPQRRGAANSDRNVPSSIPNAMVGHSLLQGHIVPHWSDPSVRLDDLQGHEATAANIQSSVEVPHRTTTSRLGPKIASRSVHAPLHDERGGRVLLDDTHGYTTVHLNAASHMMYMQHDEDPSAPRASPWLAHSPVHSDQVLEAARRRHGTLKSVLERFVSGRGSDTAASASRRYPAGLSHTVDPAIRRPSANMVDEGRSGEDDNDDGEFPPASSAAHYVYSNSFTCQFCKTRRQTGNHCGGCGSRLPRPVTCDICGATARGQFCNQCGSQLPSEQQAEEAEGDNGANHGEVGESNDRDWEAIEDAWKHRFRHRRDVTFSRSHDA